MKKVFLIVGVIVTGSFFVGCDKKETIDEVKNDITSTSDAVAALQEYVEVNRIFQGVSNSAEESVIEVGLELDELKSFNLAPTVNIEPRDLLTWPKTITVDFGSEGIEGKDGVLRKGVLIVNSTGRYVTEGSVHTTTFEDYYQNGHKIAGTHITTNGGVMDNLLTFNVKVNDGKVTKLNGDVIRYTQNTSRTWITGDETPLNIWDDEYEMSGIQTGVSSKGVNYKLEIIKPLHFVVLTREIKSGQLKVMIDGMQDITIDYEARILYVAGMKFPLGAES